MFDLFRRSFYGNTEYTSRTLTLGANTDLGETIVLRHRECYDETHSRSCHTLLLSLKHDSFVNVVSAFLFLPVAKVCSQLLPKV